MATFQQQIEQLEQQSQHISAQRQALSAAIQSAIADRVCADIGEFRAHVMALPMSKEQSLHWRWLAGRSEELAASTDAFAEAMVKHGYLIKKEMYFSGDHGQDIELHQDEIDLCVCPIIGESVSKEYFEENRYPLWETTSRWAEMIDAVHESAMPASSDLICIPSYDEAWTKVFYALLEARPSAINNEPRGIDGALRAIAELKLERDTAIWMAAKHEITIAAAFIGLLHGTADDWLSEGLEGSELPYQDTEDDQAFYDQQMAILGDIPTVKVKP